MRAAVRVLAGLALLAVAPPAGAQSLPRDEACLDCHRTLDDETLRRPALDYEADVHAGAGFGCLACHGNPSIGRRGGFLARPTRLEVITVCGRCHSDGAFMRQYAPTMRVDQVAEYGTSVHGQRLATHRDTSVAICTSCHPAHSIRPATDPESSVYPLTVSETCGRCHADADRMRNYDIPSDQQERYERGVHWQWMVEEEDLTAPTCNDCHGNHGAAPPGAASVRVVCGQCHSVMEDFFTGSAHNRYFDDEGLPGCATCHSNHEVHPTDDARLLELGDSLCVRCHEQGDSTARTFQVMRGLIDSLERDQAAAVHALEEAEQLGMEVSEAQFRLQEANNALVQARTAIHTFATDSVRRRITAGLAVTAAAIARGHEALGEHRFRRQGLAVSVAVILLLIIGIMRKIREMERTEAGGSA